MSKNNETYSIKEVEDNRRLFESGHGHVVIESCFPDEVIGRIIRRKLEQAKGANITVSYFTVTDEMQRIALGNLS